MPQSKYIQLFIDEQPAELSQSDQLPISINYKLEDPENFQNKKSTEAFDVTVPATPVNDQIGNTFHNPAVEDLTASKQFRSNRKVLIEANGNELLAGKAFLTSATHDDKPVEYSYNCYGGNGDWLIDLQDTTLFDLLKHINFTFTKQRIIDSWAYDGTSEALPYVFAPVRYRQPMNDLKPDNGDPIHDKNMKPEYMRPALSKYWLLYWAFKSLGYKISSQFLDSSYFRRQVMPWTWGNFLFTDDTITKTLDFLAKSTRRVLNLGLNFTGFWDLLVSNDSTNGAFDNNNVYQYVAPVMKYTYNPAFNYGTLEATFHLNVFVDAACTANSDVELRVQYFKNGVRIPNGNDNGHGTELVNLHAPTIGRREFHGPAEDWFTVIIDPGDLVEAKIYLHTFNSGAGLATISATVDAWELDYFRIPLGGIINFNNYPSFKKWKFLDFFRGVIDEFNLSTQTDSINKVVTIEPTHPYPLANDFTVKQPGYFNGNHQEWTAKQDLSKISTVELYSDSEREHFFKYKADGNDGILKVVQDRFTTTLAMGKYLFPNRFKTGTKETINRFFSAVMHYDVEQWKGLGSDPNETPQMICLVPENISNTSRDEAQNTFEPKSAYYKGLVGTMGWIFDGDIKNQFPFMFAVNYKTGGQNDPILSYSDERIGKDPDQVVGKGLLKRFFWQRLAIMRNGQFYKTPLFLNNYDITNWLHREHIIISGQRWELVEINGYKPLLEQSTECFLRKSEPVLHTDFDNTFPKASTVLTTAPVTDPYDFKYSPLKCLTSDIPIN